ncbi:MAG: PHP domain-containing protein [bacterium]
MVFADKYASAVARLNAESCAERLAAAQELAARVAGGDITLPVRTVEVNNHVHTCHSFSPYSPTAAAWGALSAGLQAVGIMDHDSVAGVDEMLAAGAIFGIATTAGFEVRVRMDDTPFAGRALNGPGLTGIAYIAVHGIPAPMVARCAAFLRPVNTARNARNRAMVARLNELLRAQGIPEIDFDADVFAKSYATEGGSITERHILAALSQKLIDLCGQGAALVTLLEEKLKLELPGKIRGFLLDTANPHYLYDLLGVLKSSYTDAFFIDPGPEECPEVRQVLALAEEIGAISAYAYLGDVTESPTGDKKAEKFEDEFLDELIICLRDLGFRAITYMPPRNTPEQLERIRTLCESNGLLQISGVDINSSRQSFNCPEILDPRHAGLITATWALIGHEKLASVAPQFGFFQPAVVAKFPVLPDRLAAFAAVGQALDQHQPTIMPTVAREITD